MSSASHNHLTLSCMLDHSSKVGMYASSMCHCSNPADQAVSKPGAVIGYDAAPSKCLGLRPCRRKAGCVQQGAGWSGACAQMELDVTRRVEKCAGDVGSLDREVGAANNLAPLIVDR